MADSNEAVIWEGSYDPESEAVFRVVFTGSDITVLGRHRESPKWREASLEDGYEAMRACLTEFAVGGRG